MDPNPDQNPVKALSPIKRAGIYTAGIALIIGAFFGAKALTGSNASGTTFKQVGGPSETNSLYPGAIVLPQAFGKPTQTFTNTSNQSYSIQQATNKQLTLVYFGYTHCPDVCPLNMALTADAISDLPAVDKSKINVLFVTTDPARDTPAVMRKWLNNFNSSFIGLTASITQIHQAESEIGMPLSYPEGASTDGNYQVAHAGYTLIYSQDNLAHLEVNTSENPKGYATTLEHLLASGYKGR